MAHLRELLTIGPVVVMFTKSDGSIRHMRSTTNKELIEAALSNKPYNETKIKVKDDNLYKVFDMDINQFRSFRMERVIGWTTEFPLPDTVDYVQSSVSIPIENKGPLINE